MVGRLAAVLVASLFGAGCTSPAAVDGGTDSGADTAWSPQRMTGLVLWLNSGTAVVDGGVVVGWPDSSPRGNDFAGGSASQSPTIDPAAINGVDAVRFTSAGATLMSSVQTTADFQWGTGAFLNAVVVRPGACVATCLVWETYDDFMSNPVYLYVSSLDGGSQLVATAAFSDPTNAGLQGSSAPFASGQPHILAVRRTSPSSAEVRVDGISSSFGLASPLDFQFKEGGNLGYGTLGVQVLGLDGDVAEVIGAVASPNSDVAQLEAYWKAKYGL
jgi:hypothetical protein